jgi:hypothetical protein
MKTILLIMGTQQIYVALKIECCLTNTINKRHLVLALMAQVVQDFSDYRSDKYI